MQPIRPQVRKKVSTNLFFLLTRSVRCDPSTSAEKLKRVLELFFGPAAASRATKCDTIHETARACKRSNSLRGAPSNGEADHNRFTRQRNRSIRNASRGDAESRLSGVEGVRGRKRAAPADNRGAVAHGLRRDDGAAEVPAERDDHTSSSSAAPGRAAEALRIETIPN